MVNVHHDRPEAEKENACEMLFCEYGGGCSWLYRRIGVCVGQEDKCAETSVQTRYPRKWTAQIEVFAKQARLYSG